jgi:hypothetical protein
MWSKVPGVQVCVGLDDGAGPFNCAQAQNRARSVATGDILLMYGADQIPPSPDELAWIVDRMQRHPWTAVYATTRDLSQYATLRVLHGGADPRSLSDLGRHIGMCTGILAIRPNVWDAVGGMDERFCGWGAEDTAFRLALRTLYPDGNDVGEGTLLTLWHPPEPRDRTPANMHLYAEYVHAAGRGELREYLQGARNPWAR